MVHLTVLCLWRVKYVWQAPPFSHLECHVLHWTLSSHSTARRLLPDFPTPSMTLSSEEFHFSWRCCSFIWFSSFCRGGACNSLQRFQIGVRTQMSCPESALLPAVVSVSETVVGEENLLSSSGSFLESSGRIFILPSVVSSRPFRTEAQRKKSLFKSHLFLMNALLPTCAISCPYVESARH